MRARSFMVSLSVCLAVFALAGCGGASHQGQQRTADTQVAATTARHQQSSSTTSTGHQNSPAITTGASTATSGTSASATLAPNKLARYFGDLATYGSPASGAQRAAILSSFDAYFHAIVAGDWSAVCARLSSTVQRSLGRLLRLAHRSQTGCAAALKVLAARRPRAARRAQHPISVLVVRVKGSRAFVLYRAQEIRHAFLGMVNEAGTWRATALGGSSL